MSTTLVPDAYEYDEITIVDAEDLLPYTQMAGWKMLAVVNYTKVYADPRGPYETWYVNGEEHRNYPASAVIDQPRYLLGRNQKERELDVALRTAQDANVKYRDEAIAAKKGLEEAQRQVVLLEESLESHGAGLRVMEGNLTAEHGRLREMEEDIAKIRKAVGEDRMKEILEREND